MDDLPQQLDISADDWAATPHAVRQVIHALVTIVAQHQPQIADLQQRMAQLEARLNQHSQNFLTVSATCRKQHRHLLTFVTEAIAACWAGKPAPTLVSAIP